VIKATMAQMMKVSYVHTLSYTSDSAEDLARFLLEGNQYKISQIQAWTSD
jgi:adenosylmethionine-8-amino-7-oxononanoate aminotransferase